MKRGFYLLLVVVSLILLNVGSSSALQWYFGTDPNSDYVVETDPVYDLFIPWTFNNDSTDPSDFAKPVGLSTPILLNGSDVDYNVTYTVSATNQPQMFVVVAPGNTNTVDLVRLIGLAPDPISPGDNILPTGTFTPGNGVALYIHYPTDASGNLIDGTTHFDPYAPINSFRITVRGTSVPDASVMLLLGSSLLGLGVFSRKSKRN